jgi:signal transduction histidine kinase
MIPRKGILLAEDNETSLKLLKAVFEADYDVYTAGDGLEALEILFQYPVDLIISDVLMPNLDGYHLTFRIRTNPRFRDIPVIIYTATYISMSEERTAREMGATYYLRKPSPVRFLSSLVAEILAHPEKYPHTVPDRPEAEEKMSHYSARLIAKLEQNSVEQEKANGRLRQSETMLREAQKIAKVGSWEIDLLSGEHFWSDELFKMFGVINNGGINPSAQSFLSFVHQDDLARVTSEMDQAFLTFQDSFFHFDFVRANGEIGHGRSEWKFKRNNDEHPTKIFGVIQDVTEQTKSENERLKMIDDILQRNRNLEQFSYVVSHNLRAPVANILGLCYASNIKDLSDVDRKKIMEGLVFSSKNLDEVIRDLNTILNLKSETNYETESISFSKLVDDVSASIKALVERKNVQILCDFSEIGEIKSLRGFIHSIFYNLISNSIKYHRPGIPPQIKISSRMNKSKVELVFADNGIGIDLGLYNEHLFGMYKRFHPGMAEGKGMGLYIVKTQVENLGGSISVKSVVNQGTEFLIVL